MMRIVIEYVVPLLLPTMLWILWLVWGQHRARAAGRPPPNWQKVPVSWLLAAGLTLAMLIAVGGTMIRGYSTGHYHPASVDQHGHFRPAGFD
jgi:purine-cytosine permease-like protein